VNNIKYILSKCFVSLVFAIIFTGCAEVSEYVIGEEELEPTKLSKFEQTLVVELAWSMQLNTTTPRYETRLDPVEDNGVVYLVEPQGRIVAHDAMNGNLVWETLLQKAITGGLGKGNGILLVGTENAEVIALDIKTGKTIWTTFVSSEVLSPPQVSNDTVLVFSGDGVISAINATSGKRLWVNRNAVPALSLRGTSVPIIYKNQVIVGLSNGKLISMDINNGKRIWETSIAVAKGRSELERIVDIDSAIRIKDGIIYVVSYQGKLSAVDLTDGRINWIRDLSSYQDIEISDAHIYITDNVSKIWALDRSSGATLWRQDKLSGRTLTAPVVQSDYLVVGDYKGFVHWLSREDGHLVAREDMEKASTISRIVGSIDVFEDFDTGGDFLFRDISGILATPLAVGNMLYVSDKGGVLAAYKIGKKP